MTDSGPAATRSKWKECMNEEVTIFKRRRADLSPLAGPLLPPRRKKIATIGKQNKRLFSANGKRVFAN